MTKVSETYSLRKKSFSLILLKLMPMLCIESILSMPWHLPCDYYHARRKGVITSFWLISSCPRCTLKICTYVDCVCGVVGSVYDPTFTISHFFSFYVCTRVQSSKAGHSGKIFIFMGHTINDHHLWSTLMVKMISIYYLSLILWTYLDFYERIRSN